MFYQIVKPIFCDDCKEASQLIISFTDILLDGFMRRNCTAHFHLAVCLVFGFQSHTKNRVTHISEDIFKNLLKLCKHQTIFFLLLDCLNFYLSQISLIEKFACHMLSNVLIIIHKIASTITFSLYLSTLEKILPQLQCSLSLYQGPICTESAQLKKRRKKYLQKNIIASIRIGREIQCFLMQDL